MFENDEAPGVPLADVQEVSNYVAALNHGLERPWGVPAASVLRVFEHLQRNPILSIPAAAEKIGISMPTVAKSLEHMQALGMLREITGRQRHRLFVYDGYLAILAEGTEPIR